MIFDQLTVIDYSVIFVGMAILAVGSYLMGYTVGHMRGRRYHRVEGERYYQDGFRFGWSRRDRLCQDEDNGRSRPTPHSSAIRK